MLEKNIGQKVLITAIVIVLALITLVRRDPNTGDWRLNLRGGQDIEGGVSMIYEINDEGAGGTELAEQMKELLAKRVDPDGVFDLTWRVHGRNRLEVQMPLPPPDAKLRRAEVVAATEQLFSSVPTRRQVEAALSTTAESRPEALARLAGGSEKRKAALERAAKRYDDYLAARRKVQELPASQPAAEGSTEPTEEARLALQDAQELWEDSVDEVLSLNLNPARFNDVLTMAQDSPARVSGIDAIKKEYPEFSAAIDNVLTKYAAWDRYKGKLDGPEDLQRLLRGAGVLEFVILSEPSAENATRLERYRQQLKDYGPREQPGDTDRWYRIDNPTAFFNLRSPADLKTFDPRAGGGIVADMFNDAYYVLASNDARDVMRHGKGRDWKLAGARIGRDSTGRPNVEFAFDAAGASLFGELTGRHLQRQLCIIVDDIAYSHATIQSRITRSGEIHGDFSADKVNYLVQTMNAGALPARLKDTPISERVIGSTLGQQNLQSAMRAGLIAVCAVLLFMIIYYTWGGMIANAALLMNVLLTLAMMALLQARFTLPGIAGMILSIGMVVDANVLIFERMREEKERGASLRVMIKNGYDKAMSTIIDANLTTLLTSLIIYYVGSEEIKGFGLTLGWGIALGLFTSVWVTRVIFGALLKYKLLKDFNMLKFIGVPNIDWYGMRRFFIPLSLFVTLGGLVLMGMRTKEEIFDVEFNGGVAAEVELMQPVKGEEELRSALTRTASALGAEAANLQQAVVTEVTPGRYALSAGGIPSRLLEAIISEPLEERNWLRRGSVDSNVGPDRIEFGVEGEHSAEELQTFARSLSRNLENASDTLSRSNIGIVLDAEGKNTGKLWNFVTTEKNRRIVQYALEKALGENLVRQPRIAYQVRNPGGVPSVIDGSRLESVLPGLPENAAQDVTDYRGGAAIWLDALDPPQALDVLRTRLANMRLQPGYQDYPYRKFELVGVAEAGKDNTGRALYKSLVLLVVDPAYRYSENQNSWTEDFAGKELSLATTAMDTEQSLRRVSQFKPQIAAQSARKAILALVFAWLMIIAYVWVRFGRVSYGVGGVVALIHDVLVALAFVGFSGLVGGHDKPLGRLLLIDDFRIDMTVIAALLTIIGFSINDTIVIFDRIRETKGRLGKVTPGIINTAINQTMSRTIITSFTAGLTLLVMYIWGGSSIRGFNYCMLVGIVTGVYSTIAIAAPIILVGTKVEDDRPSAARPATT